MCVQVLCVFLQVSYPTCARLECLHNLRCCFCCCVCHCFVIIKTNSICAPSCSTWWAGAIVFGLPVAVPNEKTHSNTCRFAWRTTCVRRGVRARDFQNSTDIPPQMSRWCWVRARALMCVCVCVRILAVEYIGRIIGSRAPNTLSAHENTHERYEDVL